MLGDATYFGPIVVFGPLLPLLFVCCGPSKPKTAEIHQNLDTETHLVTVDVPKLLYRTACTEYRGLTQHDPTCTNIIIYQCYTLHYTDSNIVQGN